MPNGRSSGGGAKKLSPLKRLEQNILALFKLGRTERRAKAAEREIHRLNSDLEGLRSELETMRIGFEGTTDRTLEKVSDQGTAVREIISARSAEIHRMTADLSRRLDVVAGLSKSKDRADSQERLDDGDLGLQSFLDGFYHNLENRYRGSTSEIGRRLAVYRPDIDAAALRCHGKPVLDLGCGRGEWLSLLRNWGISARGVDLNEMQIEQARADGLDVRRSGFRKALQDAPDDSLSAVTAHHLIEHIPFKDVAWLVREAMRALAPGGVLLLETPDVRNVLVGATSFHNDPTHLQPRTAAAMSVLLETAGFHPVETRRLHPHERLDEFLDKPGVDPEIGYLLFGAQDLVILGHKPLPVSQ